ncbi:MAG TPA: hypothetical protein VMF69_10235, partial [Gemmataceae bacterium]|nr:hypothetical protein [Gemmataceae bacterium]
PFGCGATTKRVLIVGSASLLALVLSYRVFELIAALDLEIAWPFFLRCTIVLTTCNQNQEGRDVRPTSLALFPTGSVENHTGSPKESPVRARACWAPE